MNPIISNNSDLRQKLIKINTIRDAILANGHKDRLNYDDATSIIIDLSKNAKSKRIIIGIGGFPGSGKTTAAKIIATKLNIELRAPSAAYLPMDGFHYANSVLEAKKLANVKGDVTTYDVERYLAKLTEFKGSSGRTIVAPDYIREKHDVFENMIEIDAGVRILVTEGIYLGYVQGNWRNVSEMLDIVFYLDTSPEQCADRIVARNLQVGRSAEVIEAKLANDFRFMEKSIQGFENSDYILELS